MRSIVAEEEGIRESLCDQLVASGEIEETMIILENKDF